jgi:hypothetical protein
MVPLGFMAQHVWALFARERVFTTDEECALIPIVQTPEAPNAAKNPSINRIMRAVGLGLAVLLFVAAPAGGSVGGEVSCTFRGGLSSPSATVNEAGEILTAWQDSRVGGQESCESAVVAAAIGSTKTGFADMGVVSAPAHGFSVPRGTFLDDRGNGWVVGVDGYEHGSKSPGAVTGAWFAFRPAGGHFQRRVDLRTKHYQAEEVFVAGSPAGRALLAWNTRTGSYVAWGTPTGRTSTPTFFGHEFQTTALGVDDKGRALIVGDYSGGYSEAARAIAVITSGASGSFSGPRTIAVAPRSAPGRPTPLSRPVVGIGPQGSAVIAYEIEMENQQFPYERPGPDVLVYRRADGHFNKPVRWAKGFLEGGRNAAVVDGNGRAMIVSQNYPPGELRATTVAGGGRVGGTHLLPGGRGANELDLSANTAGQVIITLGTGCLSCSPTVILADIQGHHSKPMVLPTAVAGGEAVATVNAQGTATVLWMIHNTNTYESMLDARAIEPGAQTVQIANGTISRE